MGMRWKDVGGRKTHGMYLKLGVFGFTRGPGDLMGTEHPADVLG